MCQDGLGLADLEATRLLDRNVGDLAVLGHQREPLASDAEPRPIKSNSSPRALVNVPEPSASIVTLPLHSIFLGPGAEDEGVVHSQTDNLVNSLRADPRPNSPETRANA